MILIGLILGLATIFCAGYGLARLLLVASARPNLLEVVALSWLLGTTVISFFLWLFGILISGPLLQAIVTISCVALGGVGLHISCRSDTRCRFPRPKNLSEWLLLTIIAAEIAIMFLLSFRYPLGWDGLLNWEIKARYAFLNGGVIPAAYYTDISRSFSHPDYPPYLPLAELWLYLWMGEAHQFWLKIIFPIFYASGAILLAIVSARLAGRRWIGGLVAALFFFVPFLTTTGYGGVLHGYADFPLSVFYLVTVGYLLLGQGNDESSLRLYLVFLALLPWIKREGVILWTVAALCGAIVIWREKKSWRWFVCLLSGVVTIVLWQIFLIAMHGVRSREFVPMSVSTLYSNFDRGGRILQGLCAEVMHINRWSLFWFLAVAAFVYLFARARDLRLAVLSLTFFAPIAAYCGTYFFSSWEDYFAHIATSLPRLLLQVVPIGWLAIGLALRPPSLNQKTATDPIEPSVSPAIDCFPQALKASPLSDVVVLIF